MTDKPTPKEIDDLVYELRQAGKDDTYSLVCAVLEKWGTPAMGGEPAGTVGYTVHGTQYVNWRTKPPAHGTPLYTTPQPTKTQAVALLDYAMQIAHERELRVTGFPHDEDGAKRVFEAAVMRHTATGAAEADSVQEDAARYRWLRRWKGQEHEPPFTVQHEIDGTLWGGDLDAAIDAARKQGEKQ